MTLTAPKPCSILFLLKYYNYFYQQGFSLPSRYNLYFYTDLYEEYVYWHPRKTPVLWTKRHKSTPRGLDRFMFVDSKFQNSLIIFLFYAKVNTTATAENETPCRTEVLG